MAPDAEVKPKRAFWVVLASLLWATDTPFRKPITDQGFSGTAIAFFEHVFSGGVALALTWRQLPIVKRFNRGDWLALLFIGIGGSALGLVFFTQSFAYGNPTVTILIQKLQPVIAVLLAAAVLRERITKRFALLGAIAFIASYFLAFGDATYGPPLVELLEPSSWLAPFSAVGSATAAAGLALGAALLWAGSTVFGRRLAQRYDFMVVTALRLLVGLAFLALVVAATGPLLPTGELPRLLVMGIALGYVPMYLYYRGLRSTRAQVATFAELLYAVGAIAVNWVLLGLGLTGTQLVATAVLLIAVMFLVHEQARERIAARI